MISLFNIIIYILHFLLIEHISIFSDREIEKKFSLDVINLLAKGKHAAHWGDGLLRLELDNVYAN